MTPSPKFQSVWLWYHSRVLKQVHRVIPKIPWMLGQVYTIYMQYMCSRGLYFTRFHSTASCFCVPAHLDTSALNDTKIAFNTTKLMVLCLCVTSVPKFQISISISAWPAIFNMWSCQNLQMHGMPKNDLQTVTGKNILCIQMTCSQHKCLEM